MSYTFKRLAEVEEIQEAPETAKAFVEVNGEVKRAAMKFQNKNPLTFVGDSEVSYDGSEPVTIKIPQPDYKENDPEKNGYIKNRPFYSEETIEQLLEEQTLEFTTTDCSATWGSGCVRGIANIPSSFNPEEGSKVTVTFDGVDYECDVIGYGGVASIRVGPSEEPDTIGVTCPFTFYNSFQFGAAHVDFNPEGSWTLFTSDTSTTQHTVSVKTTIENVKKIDSKFIPTPDWNQNDPNKDGYINNRPFYSEFIPYSGVVYNTVIETKTTELINQMYECEGSFSVASLPMQVSLQAGDMVRVVFDGIKYDLTVENDTLICEKRIGCQYPENIGTDLPFSIYINWYALDFEGVSGDAYLIASGEGRTHTIYIDKLKEHVHKIPSKYIDANARFDLSGGLVDGGTSTAYINLIDMGQVKKILDNSMDVFVIYRYASCSTTTTRYCEFKKCDDTMIVSGNEGTIRYMTGAGDISQITIVFNNYNYPISAKIKVSAEFVDIISIYATI